MEHSRKVIAPKPFGIPIPRAADLVPVFINQVLKRVQEELDAITVKTSPKAGRKSMRNLHARKLASEADANRTTFVDKSHQRINADPFGSRRRATPLKRGLIRDYCLN
jgi:hypothetical protein